jgi:molybdenum cofactor cytidylyltransferase
MTGLIILAAGASTRLGRPKQNVVFKGKTLLRHAVDAGIESTCEPVIVVLGASSNLIGPPLTGLPVHLVENENWPDGMASSIHTGMHVLKRLSPEADNVIIMLCDQPFADAALLDQLVEQKANIDKNIVACAYNGTVGPPALFDSIYFDALLLLKGHEGAKKLLLKHADDVLAIPFPLGAIDVDTVADMKRLGNL